jgi:protein gp37
VGAGCYSEAQGQRFRRGRPFTRVNIAKVEPFLSEKELRALSSYGPLTGHKCFVGDMTDIFGDWIPDEMLTRLFAVLAMRSDATFQMLTKWPARMARLFVDPTFIEQVTNGGSFRWPLANCWLGTSVGYAGGRGRIDQLRQVPAQIRFVSFEPLIGPVGTVDLTGIGWAILGGQSGEGFRPMDLDWLADLHRQCVAADVRIWTKQDSGQYPGRRGRIPDELWTHQWPADQAIGRSDGSGPGLVSRHGIGTGSSHMRASGDQ